MKPSTIRRMFWILRRPAGNLFDYTQLDLFGWTQSEQPDLPTRSGISFRHLENTDFEDIKLSGGRFAQQARRYYEERGIRSAYGVFVGTELAHVSWLYTHEGYVREPYCHLKLNEDEVEIVNCYTLEAYRGRRLYTYAIHHLVREAFLQNMRGVYMMTDYDNVASRRGILRAGLRPIGRVNYLVLFPKKLGWFLYYYRSSKVRSELADSEPSTWVE